VSGSSAKFLFNSGISPFQVVQLRLTITALLLLIIMAWKCPALLKIARSDISYFAVLGIVGMASVQFTYMYAISRIHVAAAILLQYMAPVLIVLHLVCIAREKVNPVVFFSMTGAIAGCYLVVGAYTLDMLSMNLGGVASGLLSAAGFAWYTVHGEYGMRRYNPWTVLFYAMLFAALVWNILHPPLESFQHHYLPVQWLWILYIAILGTMLPFGLYLNGVSHIRSARASITGTLEPITAGIVSFLFLHENMEPLQIVGGVLVIISIVLLQAKSEIDEQAPEKIRARGQIIDG
jgi:drug/metabolite transporter (DMT)-like permease